MIWQAYKGTSLERATGKLGEYSLSSSESDNGRIRFTPNLGKSWGKLYEESKAFDDLGDEKYNMPEFWLSHSALSPHDDIITVDSKAEAKHIVDLFESLDGPIPTWRESLAVAGLVEKPDYIKGAIWFEHPKQNFSLSMHDDPGQCQDMWLRYEPPRSSHWYNLAIMKRISRSHDDTKSIPHWWPQGYDAMDLMGLIVQRIIKIRVSSSKRKPKDKPTLADIAELAF